MVTSLDRSKRFGVGAVLELAEADYLYGTGTLALRVTRAEVDPAQYRAMEWVNANGVEIYHNGTTGPVRPVAIRVSAIKAALRPARWIPPVYPSIEPIRRGTTPT